MDTLRRVVDPELQRIYGQGTPWDGVGEGIKTTAIQHALRDPKSMEALREAGIPGIRYLDAGSRDAGEGSRNYVVFDDNLLDILHKWRGDEQLYSGGLPSPLPPQRRNALSDPTVY